MLKFTPFVTTQANLHLEKLGGGGLTRAPADREASINVSGFIRPGLGVTVCKLPSDQEEASAWQRQSGPGAARDS